MAYEAAVPVRRHVLWSAVADPRRLFGALPGAVVDAVDAHGAAGRLRLRVGQQTITFRGIARIVEVDEAAARAVVELEAAYGRSGGGVDGRLEILLREDGSGTVAAIDGTLEFTGTAAAPSAQSLEAAGHRLVKRWFAALAEPGEATASEPEPQAPQRDAIPTAEAADPAETADSAEPADPVEPKSGPDPDPEPESAASEGAGPEAAGAAGTAAPAPSEAEVKELAQPAEFATRPPLAVVPDLDPADDESAGDQPALPQRRAQQKPSASAKSRAAAEGASGGSAGRPRAADFETGAAAVDRDAPARLHLVQPTGGAPDHEDDAADDDEPDIWSRRKPFLPRWLPYLAGATFVGALAFLIAVLSYLRRLRRGRHAESED